ncbi:MAG: PilZ domain-containing protein [Bradyrhizobiaceae bacterium]|nr:MAG: PilZ domain-containing protein [Bradyrhizobiaceae bacterium]
MQYKRGPKSRAKVGTVSCAGSSISCTVRSQTKSGATLKLLIGPLGVPKLVIPSDHVRNECRILWVKDKRRCVSFFQDGEF